MDNLRLNEKSIIYHLKQYRIKKYVRYYDEIASTNETAKDFCKKQNARGLVVAAASQTQGKGRLERSFFSPVGGIYFSAVYELDSNRAAADLISSAAGMAVRDTLYNFFNIDAKIKWPNDVLVDEKKICGILCEAVNENNKPKYVIVGIGVNVDKCDFPDGLHYTATSIGNVYEGEVELDKNEILVDIVNNLDRYVIRSGMLSDGYDSTDLVGRLKKYSATIGRMVRVIKPDNQFDARALDIDEKGGLVVNGPLKTETITSGEIEHLR